MTYCAFKWKNNSVILKTTMKKNVLRISQVLQSLLQLPEQEQFVDSTFLHERVTKLQVIHMHYKTIEHYMELIRKHNNIIYIMKQNYMQ